jgi:uncharacterized membrane protein
MSTLEQEGAHSPQRSGDGGQGVGRGVAAAVSLAAGAIVAFEGLSRRSIPGLLMTGVGGALLLRGATRAPRLLAMLGLGEERGAHDVAEFLDERGIEVSQAFLINRTPEELYAYWRDFENLPRIMTYLQDVQVEDERRSHWIAKAPLVADGRVEWDAEITRDQPNRLIAWHSLPDSQVDMVGEIRFRPALGDRGTEVHVRLRYVPPAGQLGHWLAKIFGKAPRRAIREDLRNFKRMMEVGELPTTTGQPRGTCLGAGRQQETES